MNILLLTPQLPYPPRQGTALRNWGLLRHLAERHAVTLISFAPPELSAPPAELAAACRSVLLVPQPKRGLHARLVTVAAGQADLADRLWSPAFEAAVQQAITTTHFDLAQVEGLELGRYLRTLRARQRGLPIVYDAHNAEVTLQERAWLSDRAAPGRRLAAAYSRLQIARLRRFEAAVCRAADAVTCVSQVDADSLRQGVPEREPTIVPNGIELADYPLPGEDTTHEPILTFTGKMDYRPNVDAALWFADAIWPRIRARCPTARFEVVGQSPAPALARLGPGSGIFVLGAVPEITPFIARGAVYVAPLRMGGGTRFKLLEAMALGRPVVSTTVGAEGFAVQSGRELLLADKAEDFAQAVLTLLDDRAQARLMGLAGRAFVEVSYDWAAIVPRLEAVYSTVFND